MITACKPYRAHWSAGVSLICWSGKEPRNSGLLINGQKQLDPEQGKLCCRPVHRFKVSDVAITGRWLFGLVLRSAHLCTLQNLNITGDDVKNGCRAAILMDGVGSPTGHTIECCRLYHFGIGVLFLPFWDMFGPVSISNSWVFLTCFVQHGVHSRFAVVTEEQFKKLKCIHIQFKNIQRFETCRNPLKEFEGPGPHRGRESAWLQHRCREPRNCGRLRFGAQRRPKPHEL